MDFMLLCWPFEMAIHPVSTFVHFWRVALTASLGAQQGYRGKKKREFRQCSVYVRGMKESPP